MRLNKNQIFLILAIISLLGLILRIPSYDRLPPFGETSDEFIYPFYGLSLIQGKQPTSWSNFSAYPTGIPVNYWGINFRLVTPLLEKPPLYPLLVGSWSFVNGQRQFSQVRLSTIRQIPLALSALTIFLTGIAAWMWFSPAVGLFAALIYAVTPIFVIGNRLSLTENFLTPIILATLITYTLSQQPRYKSAAALKILTGLGCLTAVLTKQVGIILPAALAVLAFINKDKFLLGSIFIFGTLAAAVMPVWGFLTDWRIYQNVMRELSEAHTYGLPHLIFTLLGTPGVGHKESLFPDGTLLAGWLLILASPLIFRPKNNFPVYTVFPLAFLTLMVIIEGGTTWYGWHVFPLYPFIAIFVAAVCMKIWNELDFFKLAPVALILGSSAIRFLLLNTNRAYHYRWQWLMFMLVGAYLTAWLIPNRRIKQIVLMAFFVFFIGVDIFTSIRLEHIYPVLAQPGS